MTKAKTKKTAPKKKCSRIEQECPEAFRMLDNMDYLCALYKISDKELCAAMGKSADTLRRRREKPYKFDDFERKAIAQVLHTTENDLRNVDMRQKCIDTLQLAEV